MHFVTLIPSSLPFQSLSQSRQPHTFRFAIPIKIKNHLSQRHARIREIINIQPALTWPIELILRGRRRRDLVESREAYSLAIIQMIRNESKVDILSEGGEYARHQIDAVSDVRSELQGGLIVHCNGDGGVGCGRSKIASEGPVCLVFCDVVERGEQGVDDSVG